MDDVIRGCPVLADNGERLIPWIAHVSGSCIYGTMGELSFVFGYMSLFAWLWAQLPQVIKNYRNHSVEGLSWLFLFNWLLGDATNLIGCLLTNQLPFQTLLAGYYLSIDVILCSQFVYYTKIKSQNYYVLLSPSEGGSRASSISSDRSSSISTHSSHTVKSSRSNRRAIMLALSAVVAIAGAMLVPPIVPEYDDAYQYSIPSIAASSSSPDSAITILSGFNGLRRWFKLNSREFVGRVFAWACTTLYLSSRMPQIYTNFVRQSTSGLSILLFIAAFCGNLFYSLSILTSAATMDGAERSDFLWEELPYLIGSAGTVGFDFTIFCQWIIYGEGKLFFHNLYYGRQNWDAVELPQDSGLSVSGEELIEEEMEDHVPAQQAADSSSSSGSSSSTKVSI
ncbi:PQ loop repeat-domain-containing protein [Myxozyma melibiosi]|uniref:PQ loop repeat-domain-containing protein n=1 Tax=Myxozyma melibiosi TaxID=54550 RepID=A0ABR1FC24_9ASCO